MIENEVDAGIINNLTDPCAKAIFSAIEIEIIKKKLLQEIMQPTAKVNLTFAESILKLFNDSNTFNLSINNDYLKKATDLSIARTIIHEMPHAYINTLFYDHREFDSFDYHQKLVEYANINGYGTDMSRIQHEFMGQYVDAMAASLLIWDEKYGSKINLRWEYYRSMAYGGLRYTDSNGNDVDTDSFKALVPKASERDKIKIILTNEKDGNYNAKGKKCN